MVSKLFVSMQLMHRWEKDSLSGVAKGGEEVRTLHFQNMILEICSKTLENISRRAFPAFARV